MLLIEQQQSWAKKKLNYKNSSWETNFKRWPIDNNLNHIKTDKNIEKANSSTADSW